MKRGYNFFSGTSFHQFFSSFGSAYHLYVNYSSKAKMLTTTMSDFSKDVVRYLNSVADNDETLIINRGNDNGVVVLSLDEYNSLCATHRELSSKINEQRLDSAIAKLRSGSSFQKELENVDFMTNNQTRVAIFNVSYSEHSGNT